MNTRILGIIGSVLLIAGIFVPIVSAFGVNINYFDSMSSGYNDGYIFVGLGVISLIIALININRILIATGLISLIMVALAFIGFKSRISEASSGSASSSALSDAIQLQWGWAVLVLGGLLLLVAGIMKKSVVAAPPSYGAPPPGYNPQPPGYNQPPPNYPQGPGQPPPPPYNR